MNSERDSVDDLPVLARRGALSESGQARLSEALAASEEAQVLHDAGLAFDAEAPVLAGDEERIERIARRVQQGTRRFRISPRVQQAAQSVALGVLIAGVAVAAIELSRWHPRASERGALPRTAQAGAKPANAHPSLAHDEQLVPVAHEAAQPEALQTNPMAAQARRPAAVASSASASQPAVAEPSAPGAVDSAQNPAAPAKFKTASELFADANQARMRGDAQAAIAISQLLEATFPNSTEGITTHLSLGVLYAQQGQPEQALQEFKIYRHIGSSAVMAEALWGEEQALQKLGRTSEERAVLEELLQNYPRSVYAAAAEKRLAALNN
jgi:tetratricopeptide (TPR) repeat protein